MPAPAEASSGTRRRAATFNAALSVRMPIIPWSLTCTEDTPRSLNPSHAIAMQLRCSPRWQAGSRCLPFPSIPRRLAVRCSPCDAHCNLRVMAHFGKTRFMHGAKWRRNMHDAPRSLRAVSCFISCLFPPERPIPFRSQLTSRTNPAAIPPVMQLPALAEIAGMGLGAHHVH